MPRNQFFRGIWRFEQEDAMKNPLIPMGAITGPMTRDEIATMMRRYADAGIERYLFYARGGCDVPFMSEEWLDICENIVLEAEALGIEIWLYDEYDCPSGTCHKTIIEDHPEYESACVCVIDGKCTVVRGSAYVKMADLMNPAVTDLFIERTYERLNARLGDKFGKVIKGVFTDEPSLAFESPEAYFKYPYTDGIENEYKARFGRDLFEGLASGDAKCIADYIELVGEKLRTSYVDKIAAWCEAHGVLMTGHLLEEEDVRTSVMANGDAIRTLRGFSVPGMDEIFTNIGKDTEWLTLGTVAAASRYKKNGAIAELFAFGPCDQPIARMLQMIYLVSLFGVDKYVLAVSACDAKGSAVKTDWCDPTNYMQPYFECFSEFGEEAKRAAVLAGKQIAADVAIVYPVREEALNRGTSSRIVGEKLTNLINELNALRYGWVLIDRDEKTPEGAVRVEWDTDITVITSLVTPKVTVTEDGKTADEVFIRRYTDGTYCVLDLRDGGKARRLTVSDGKDTYAIDLYPRELYISSDPREEYETVSSIGGALEMKPDRESTLRCVFHDGILSHTFDVSSSIDIKVNVRNFRYDGKVWLDGVPVHAENVCMSLPIGYGELYQSSEKITLCAGTHTVTVSEYAGRSEPFLPAVFLSGDFFSDGKTLSPRNDTATVGEDLGDKLIGYAGKISFTARDVAVPADDAYITITGGENATRVYIDGELIGTRVCLPMTFRIPNDKRGKLVNVTVERYTAIGAIFGNRDDVLDGISKNRVLYKYFPYSYRERGIESILICIKK